MSLRCTDLLWRTLKEYIQQNENPSGQKYEDMLLYVRQHMFQQLKVFLDKKSMRDDTVAVLPEDMLDDYFFKKIGLVSLRMYHYSTHQICRTGPPQSTRNCYWQLQSKHPFELPPPSKPPRLCYFQVGRSCIRD